MLFGKVLHYELAPLDDRGAIRLNVTAVEGTSYDLMDSHMRKIDQYIADSIPETRTRISITSPGFTGSYNANQGLNRLIFTDADQRKRSQQQLADIITTHLKKNADVRAVAIQQQTISVGSTRGLAVQYVVQAPSFEALRSKLPAFLGEVQKSKFFSVWDVDLKFNKPEIDLSVQRDRARLLGVQVSDVARTIQLAFGGTRYDYFIKEGRQYSVIGQVERASRDRPSDLKSLYVRGTGGLVQLDNVVTMEERSLPPSLYKFNRYESATISASPAPGFTVGDCIQELDRIKGKTLNTTFSTSLTGSSRDYAESNSTIYFALGLALMLIYLVLAAQFESFIDPLIIMLTVPLALFGALFSLWYTNQTMNIFSEIGIIVLIGLVTKNGILIVEFANQLKGQGRSIEEAILEASVSRLRPILMTTIVAVLGSLPIALAIGSGSASRTGLGVVVVGGLSFSLVLTLFIIPAVYTFLSRKPSEKAD